MNQLTESLTDICAAKEAFRDWLLARKSIPLKGIGVGLKESSGQLSNELCIQFYVDEEASKSKLQRRNGIPKSIDGFFTDVRPASTPRFMSGILRPTKAEIQRAIKSRRSRSRTRPLVAGISCANQFVNAGTLGYFCKKNRDDSGAMYLLSSGHVFKAKTEYKKSSAILQASPSDGGNMNDVVADFDSATRLSQAEGARNVTDAAIARLRDDIKYKPEIQDVGPLKGTVKPVLGMSVAKVGRTTGFTEGVVTAIDYEAIVPWGVRSVQATYTFKNQIRIEPTKSSERFADFGDSGSMVFTKSNPAAVGLYFAGAPDGSYGLATPIASVEQALDIKLLV
jgi:endonuclease G